MNKKCSFCGEHTKLKKKNPSACARCYDKYCRPKRKCVICDKINFVKQITDEGPICGTCYKQKYIQPPKRCKKCDKLSKIVSNGLCSKCRNYKPKQRECSICGKNRKISISDPCICCNCYRKMRISPQSTCNICYKEKETQVRGKYGGSLCCYCVRKFRDKEKCSSCGEINILTKKLCPKCYNKQYKRKDIFCICCRKIKTSHYRLNGLTICNTCYNRLKYHNSEEFRIKSLTRDRVNKALKTINFKKKYKIDYEAIKNHVGPKPSGNYHLDHIIPLCAFDLSDEKEFYKAFAPENHQWLLASDNLSKGGFYSSKDFNRYMEKE